MNIVGEMRLYSAGYKLPESTGDKLPESTGEDDSILLGTLWIVLRDSSTGVYAC